MEGHAFAGLSFGKPCSRLQMIPSNGRAGEVSESFQIGIISIYRSYPWEWGVECYPIDCMPQSLKPLECRAL